MRHGAFTIVRHGDQWGVSSDGEVLAVSRSRRGATALARAAAHLLRDRDGAPIRAPQEPRDFTQD